MPTEEEHAMPVTLPKQENATHCLGKLFFSHGTQNCSNAAFMLKAPACPTSRRPYEPPIEYATYMLHELFCFDIGWRSIYEEGEGMFVLARKMLPKATKL